jgi:hypothetical protein
MCGGCAEFSSKPVVTLDEGFRRQLPADCEGLAERVPLPPVAKGADARKELARNRVAAVQANAKLAAVKACEAKVRAEFAR